MKAEPKRHTTVDGRPVHRPKWNGLLDYLHVLGHSTMGSFEALRRASGANLREGKYEESGFKYLPQADLSIQGVDANLAWDHSLRLARALQVPIEVTLQWRMKEGAARPGQRAALKWAPMSS
ncbi:MAG: T4SS efffector SepA family protein [Gemmatimonadota bacterium]